MIVRMAMPPRHHQLIHFILSLEGSHRHCSAACLHGTRENEYAQIIVRLCLLRRALSREPVNCDPWAAWDPLPSPDSSKRRMTDAAQTAGMGEPTNGMHDSGTQSCYACRAWLLHLASTTQSCLFLRSCYLLSWASRGVLMDVN